MISIFNSTTDYKGFVATNCEKIMEKAFSNCADCTPSRWIAAVSATEEIISRKERKVRKEMEGGWRAGVRKPPEKNAANAVTLCPAHAHG